MTLYVTCDRSSCRPNNFWRCEGGTRPIYDGTRWSSSGLPTEMISWLGAIEFPIPILPGQILRVTGLVTGAME